MIWCSFEVLLNLTFRWCSFSAVWPTISTIVRYFLPFLLCLYWFIFHSKIVLISFRNFSFIQKTSFSFKNISFIERSYFHSKILFLFKKYSFHSKKLFLFKNLIFIQKFCFHSITFHFVYAEITGQLRDHMIPTRKPRE